MLQELEPYIAKYYNQWLNYSRRTCYYLGISNEAYDVMTDTLEEFCRKSNESQSRLLVVGYTGYLKLFYSVCIGIRINAIKVATCQKARAFMDGLDAHLYRLPAPIDEYDSDELTNEEREAEAILRDDSFVTPTAVSGNVTKIPVIHLKWRRRVYADGTGYLSCCYGMEFRKKGKVIKSIRRTSRSIALAAAIQYQTQHLNK